MGNLTLSSILPKLEANAKWGGFKLKTVKGLKRAINMLQYSKARIHPFISHNIGVDMEIANSKDFDNLIRKSILN